MILFSLLSSSYPDEDAGQIPLAYVVRQPGSNINEAQVMDLIAKQVRFNSKLILTFQVLRKSFQTNSELF